MSYHLCIPRHHAIRVAKLERDSLYLRASQGGPCRHLWIRAGNIADRAVKSLERGESGMVVVPHLYRIGTGWMAAARCKGWKTP